MFYAGPPRVKQRRDKFLGKEKKMKKLLVLMLVLGMVSMANAQFSQLLISVNGTTAPDEIIMCPSDTITIGIYNRPDMGPRNFQTWLDFQYPSEGGYALGNARLGPAAGDLPASFNLDSYLPPEYPYPNDFQEYTVNQEWKPGTPGEPAGEIFLVDFHLERCCTEVSVSLYDSRLNGGQVPVDTLTIYEIPEPATIALLGLGGLAVIRKRRA
jgi:hypothetical protein